MKEKLKTLLLIFLVGTSLIMTQQLWIQFPERITKIFEPQPTYSSSYLLSDMIAPNKYLINFGKNKTTVVYDASRYRLWDSSKEAIAEVLSSKSVKIEEKEKGLTYNNLKEPSIVFYLPEKISTSIIAMAWEIKDPNRIVDAVPYIESISIVMGDGDPFFVFSGEGKHLKVYDNTIKLEEVMADLKSIEDSDDFDYYYSMSEIFELSGNDIFIPYEIRNSLPAVYVKNDLANMNNSDKETLAQRFLEKDKDYLRQIVESNGSTIYINDNRVLKFNLNGTIEYFHSLGNKVGDRNLYLSLSTAANFISQKAYSAKGMYLAEINEIEAEGSLGYKFIFKYRVRGIPVLLGNKEVNEYVQMEVFNTQVRSYRQLFRGEMNIDISQIQPNDNFLPSFDIIDRNYNFFESEYLKTTILTKEELGDSIIQKVLSSIEDITIAYYDSGLMEQRERLVTIWQIKANNKIYAFDAYSGKLVYER
ncbi:MAG: hypothetical protein GX947_09850 [Tissierellia bacterium]|nr:hypothetical protein [Tissierellia bacterium]